MTRPGPRKVNEDSVQIWSTDPQGLAAAVADGLGGMGGGQVASTIAVRLFGEYVTSAPLAPSHQAMLEVAQNIHREILRSQEERDDLSHMATTLTAINLFRYQLIGIHCGDTRAVLARGQGIKRLTTDQAEGERLLKAGKLTKDEYLEYPRRHILDSALGIHSRPPQIDGFSFELQPGDKLFLTTDGIHQKVLLKELQQISSSYDDPGRCIDEIARRVEDRTAEDNYSIAAVFVH